MREVERAAFFLLSTFCIVSLAPTALAEDAYDDEEGDMSRPSRHDDKDSEEIEDEGLELGGMRAPDALGETGDQRSEIEKELDESDERDSGRGLEYVWLSADLGFQALSLTAIHDGGLLAEGEPAGGAGVSFGGGVGARLLYFTLGARFWYADFGALSPWSLLGEAALRVPYGKLEPFGLIGVGYASVGGLSDAEGVGGVDLRLGGGLDYYLSDSFSVGAQISGDLVFLSGSSGTATGAGGSGLVMLGLHF